MVYFDKERHEYSAEDGKTLISVTQLLSKHGLAPDYSGVLLSVLRRKAERGTLIHEELENYAKHGVIGFTSELLNFVGYSKKNNLRFLESEKMVFNDIVAGTFDILFERNGKVVLGDFKTTATLHKETVAWQTSIYAYLYEKLCDTHVDELCVIWLKNEDEIEVIDLPRKSNEEIEKLFECERHGEMYTQDLKPYQQEIAVLRQLEEIIKQAEEQKKLAEEQAKSIKEKLLKAMEENAIISIDNENVKITYVAETTRTTIDSKRLKEEKPEVYTEYSKTSKVAPSLKITWRKKKVEELE